MLVWNDFVKLSSTRPSGFGASPITYLEIQAYCNLMSIDIEPWEVEMIRLFDNIALEVYSEEQKSKNNKK